MSKREDQPWDEFGAKGGANHHTPGQLFFFLAEQTANLGMAIDGCDRAFVANAGEHSSDDSRVDVPARLGALSGKRRV